MFDLPSDQRPSTDLPCFAFKPHVPADCQGDPRGGVQASRTGAYAPFVYVVMGLPVTTDQAPHWIDLDLGDGRRLGLHPEGGGLKVQPGSLQLGFKVPNVDRFVTDARLMGARVLQEPFDEAFGRLAILSDPDGYAIQVFTPRS